MARTRTTEPKVRIHISLSEKSIERISRLMSLIEAENQGEVIRNALKHYEAALLAQMGKTLGEQAEDSQGQLSSAAAAA